MSLPATARAAEKATPAARRTFEVRPARSDVRVDGVLDEAAWAEATVVPLAYEWDPGDNTPPPEPTECLLTYDRERLYVAFRAHDHQPSEIRAHLADRDAAFQDDTVGFMIDPFNDERRAFQFRINPLGVQMDATNSDVDGSEDWAWDAIWESRGRITADGYEVEVAVPFSSLRFPRTAARRTWGFLAMRDLPRSLRHRMRSAWTDRDRECVVCQADKLAGLEGITPGLNLEFDPTLTTSRTDRRDSFPAGSLRNGRLDLQPGLTARWGVTSALTLNAAVNPDFSQVEADVAQLDVNTRFALFFPEKRPLFLEGADLFSTPFLAVFTRTIADPDWGVKLSGKQGRNAVGGFLVRDSVTNLLFPSNQGSSADSLDQGAWNGLLRFRRDVRANSTVGLLYAAREGEGYHNRVGGIDGSFRLSRSDSLRFQYLRSSTDYPDAVAERNGQREDAFGGNAWAVDYSHGGRHWTWWGNYGSLSPSYRADSGFEPRVDIRAWAAGLRRTIRPKDQRWYSRLDFSASTDGIVDFAGRLTDRGFDFPITYQGPRQTSVTYNPAPNLEFFDGVTYDNFRHNLSVQVRPAGSFTFSMSGTLGKTIDFANSRRADILRLSPSVEFSLARGLNGSLSHNLQRLNVLGGQRLSLANLTELRLVWHLNVRTFVRAIVQYTDVDRDPSLYRSPVDPTTKQLFAQYLFSFKLNPQTVVLLGYSDDRLGLRNVDLTQTDRTFFLKVGYAWVL